MDINTNFITGIEAQGQGEVPSGRTGFGEALSRGDIFRAEVTGYKDGLLMLMSQSGRQFTALPEGDRVYRPGQMLEFEVTGRGSNDMPRVSVTRDIGFKAASFLSSMRAPDNAAAQALAQELISQRAEASPKQFASLVKALAQNPSLTPDKAVFLFRREIPITQANIAQYDALSQAENRMGTLLNRLLSALESNPSGRPQPQQSVQSAQQPPTQTQQAMPQQAALQQPGQQQPMQSRPAVPPQYPMPQNQSAQPQQLIQHQPVQSTVTQPQQSMQSAQQQPTQTQPAMPQQAMPQQAALQQPGQPLPMQPQQPPEYPQYPQHLQHQPRQGIQSQPSQQQPTQTQPAMPQQAMPQQAAPQQPGQPLPMQPQQPPEYPQTQPQQAVQQQHLQQYRLPMQTQQQPTHQPQPVQQPVIPPEQQSAAQAIQTLFRKISPERQRILPWEISGPKLTREIGEILSRALEQARFMPPAQRDSVHQASREIVDTLRFTHQMNQCSSFLQIPLQIGQEKTMAQLYVFNDSKKKKKIDPKNATMFLSLLTIFLGRVEGFVTVIGSNVECDFSLSNEDVVRHFRKKSTGLAELLEAKGYRLARMSSSVKAPAEPAEIEKEYESRTSRYRFDCEI
ncbi:MAG: hypothetical protein FWH04_07885 [Oscillospiraceae bacterium]|nr:hypothetical protein [Oscillospiraceae bacterium]